MCFSVSHVLDIYLYIRLFTAFIENHLHMFSMCATNTIRTDPNTNWCLTLSLKMDLLFHEIDTDSFLERLR